MSSHEMSRIVYRRWSEVIIVQSYCPYFAVAINVGRATGTRTAEDRLFLVIAAARQELVNDIWECFQFIIDKVHSITIPMT